MTRRPPSIITEFIVMIIAIGLVAGGLEAYLRVTATQQSKLYEGIDTVPEIADTYFQHVFLEKHATKDAWNNANFDPQLGWDYQIAASRIRGPRKNGPKPAGMFRVITIGDSSPGASRWGKTSTSRTTWKRSSRAGGRLRSSTWAWAATGSTRCC